MSGRLCSWDSCCLCHQVQVASFNLFLNEILVLNCCILCTIILCYETYIRCTLGQLDQNPLPE
uniref:Uncharacterized protein n=1 Tax=Rhizophora mucronata TaxID=61149 RepID=A0A2P2LLQ8_RHIMU